MKEARTGDKRMCILGAGRSGQAAQALARAHGYAVRIFDEEHGDSFPEVEPLNGESPLFVVSPGFPIDHPWCNAVREAGGTLVPELEFGASFLEGEILVITGSLGKTSMVLFAAELLKSCGFSVTVSGNIGTPVCEVAPNAPKADVHLLEASSFQLEALHSFRAHRAVCLNLFPNHLDRHGTMENYARAKARLFDGQAPQDIAVWPEEYPVEVETQALRTHPDPIEIPPCRGTRFESGPLRRNLAMLLAGLRGLEGVTPERVERTAKSFRFPEHRLQVLEIPGAGRVVDDSKSTCFSATAAALESIPGRVHLFMGGIGKGEDPGLLTSLFQKRNPVLYLFGASGKKMLKAWQDSVDECVCGSSLSEMIEHLVTTRKNPEETVLFSPGCASFDQFQGFADRGRRFSELMESAFRKHPLL